MKKKMYRENMRMKVRLIQQKPTEIKVSNVRKIKRRRENKVRMR